MNMKVMAKMYGCVKSEVVPAARLEFFAMVAEL